MECTDSKIRVLIVEQNAHIRSCILSLIGEEPDLEVIAEVRDGDGALDVLAKCPVDVVLMDLGTTAKQNLEATARITRTWRATGVVIMTHYGENEYCIRARAVGARGYVLKSSLATELIPALRSVHQGAEFVSPEL